MPSARVRLARFAPFLRDHGIDLLYEPALSDREYELISGFSSPLRKAATVGRAAARLMASRPPAADLALVHRLAFVTPLPRRDPAPRIDVYDFDDALYLGSTLPQHRRFSALKREEARWRSYVRRARLVIAGNSTLAREARRYARRVEVVPSCVDPSLQPLRVHSPDGAVHVGWVGSQSTESHLRTILPVFDRLRRRGVPFKLTVVGASPSLSAPWLEHRAWSEPATHEFLGGIDIGVMPLPPTSWNEGKCGYKLLQYMSAGVPVIASPVGTSREIVGGDRGLLATADDEWEGALLELAGDVEARRELGAAGRRYVEAHYSYQRWAPELAHMFRSLA